ncbi:putative Sugar-terminal-phosphatase [Nitrolancea hollandica Lb]|uniref:Putative Sugar-terminal-phosphatase n=2 Tax=Nitrolancea hollandica TaxID=1206749 RepID=I4ELB5_9BACT|nr:putative Sugar-terminal-phosphatase [Nitrolancea hollandica Lb]
MNGVLVNDEDLHEQAFRSVLIEEGTSLTHAEYQRYCAGRTDRDGFTDLIAHKNLRLNIDTYLVRKGHHYRRLAHGNLKVYPDASRVVRTLAASYALALASSATRFEVETALETMRIADCFAIIASAEDVSNGKPDPEIYLRVADRLGVVPGNCVVIEDSQNGILASKRAGMQCIAVAHTHEPKELAEADLIVGNIGSISAAVIESVCNRDRTRSE